VRAPAEFLELDGEHGLQKFKLIEPVFRLLTPFVQRCVVLAAGFPMGFASGLVDPCRARGDRCRFRVGSRQTAKAFAGCRELHEGSTCSAALQSTPSLAIFGIQAALQAHRAPGQSAQSLAHHKGISDGPKEFGCVSNPSILAPVYARSQPSAQQPQRCSDAFAVLAGGMHGDIVVS
jgi:hypothetical protein